MKIHLRPRKSYAHGGIFAACGAVCSGSIYFRFKMTSVPEKVTCGCCRRTQEFKLKVVERKFSRKKNKK